MGDAGVRSSTALLTDRYELTMLRGGAARTAPPNATAPSSCSPVGCRPAGGTGSSPASAGWWRRCSDFVFGDDELAALESVVDRRTLEYLAAYHVRRRHRRLPGGRAVLPGLPDRHGDRHASRAAVVLETLALSILNHDCAIASAAARMTSAAGGRPLIEMGSRRTHEESAVAAARAAYLAGFSATSNLEAGRRYGIPTTGYRGARLHAAARLGGGGVRVAGRGARRRHHAARRHLRHHRGHRDRDRGGRAASSGRCASTRATSAC